MIICAYFRWVSSSQFFLQGLHSQKPNWSITRQHNGTDWRRSGYARIPRGVKRVTAPLWVLNWPRHFQFWNQSTTGKLLRKVNRCHTLLIWITPVPPRSGVVVHLVMEGVGAFWCKLRLTWVLFFQLGCDATRVVVAISCYRVPDEARPWTR